MPYLASGTTVVLLPVFKSKTLCQLLKRYHACLLVKSIRYCILRQASKTITYMGLCLMQVLKKKTFLPNDMHKLYFNQSISLSINISIYLSINLSIYLSIDIYLSIYLSIYPQCMYPKVTKHLNIYFNIFLYRTTGLHLY